MGGKHRAGSANSRRRSLARLILACCGVALLATGVAAALHRPSRPVAEPAVDPAVAELEASFAALALPAPVGIAIVPVGGGTPILLGDQTPQHAWSTIKIPLALASERHDDQSLSDAETAAIVDSDNDSALVLAQSLGTPDQAVEGITAALRAGGDSTTVVPPGIDGSWPLLGDTVWGLRDSAAWTAQLPCLRGSEHVLDLMANVSGGQQWGLRVLDVPGIAVKGGWGPEDFDDGYLVRQIGLLPLRDGRVAVSMSVHLPEMSYETGIEALDTAARWLGEHLDLLPAGTCPETPATAPATPEVNELPGRPEPPATEPADTEPVPTEPAESDLSAPPGP